MRSTEEMLGNGIGLIDALDDEALAAVQDLPFVDMAKEITIAPVSSSAPRVGSRTPGRSKTMQEQGGPYRTRRAGVRSTGVWRTLVSALLILAGGAYAPLSAAPTSPPLPVACPTLQPQQGMLIIYSEQYVIEDDGVLVFRRRPVEVYTDTGQLVGVYATFGDAPIRLEVAPGNYIVAFQSDGKMQKRQASVKDREQTIVPEAPSEPPAAQMLVSPR
jgi:hypothetical protein